MGISEGAREWARFHAACVAAVAKRGPTVLAPLHYGAKRIPPALAWRNGPRIQERSVEYGHAYVLCSDVAACGAKPPAAWMALFA